MFTKIFTIDSEKQLDEIAEFLTPKIKNGGTLALRGELGAGKTTLTKRLIKNLGSDQIVTSPTFSILNIFKLSDRQRVYHFDLYRLKSQQELNSIGFSEVLEDQQNIAIIEWPELAQPELPDSTIWIDIEITNETERKISISSIKEL